MEDKDRIDAFLRLAEIQQRGFERRVGVEWKMTAILWAAIFATTVYLIDHIDLITVSGLQIGYAIFYGLYVIWLWRLGRANLIDKHLKYYYTNQIKVLMGLKIESESHPDFKSNKYKYPILSTWLILELAFTTLLLIISYSIIKNQIGP
jgi:hypothetical protein